MNVKAVVRRAFKNPDNERLQEKLYTAMVEHPDQVEAALEDFEDRADEKAMRRAESALEDWDPDGIERYSWSSHVGLTTSQPLRFFHPRTTAHVQHILELAAKNGRRVRAVGGGYSVTDCMVTHDYMVDTRGLSQVLAFDDRVLKGGVDTTFLVRTQAGIRVSALNESLSRSNRCMSNNTAFDGQSLIGMLSTGSHGTGLVHGAIADFVRSLTMVGEGGEVFRIEPALGMTDAAAFAAHGPGHTLIQNDDVFNSAIVSMGCFGVITEVVLEVEQDYFLEETRELMSWQAARKLLENGILHDHRHVAMLLNPYTFDDQKAGIDGHSCIVALRNPHKGPKSPGHRYNALVSLGNLFPKLPSKLMKSHPKKVRGLLAQALRVLNRDDGQGGLKPYIDRGADILNFGGRQRDSAYALNVGVGLDVHLHAIEATMKAMGERADQDEQWATAPLSLRWTGPSKAYMAPQFGRDTCMIEPPALHPTVGGRELLYDLQNLLYRFGGRPHWGLEFNLSGTADLPRRLWPEYDKWMAQYRRFNAKGTFDSVFTDRLGFSAIAIDKAGV